MNNSVKNDIQKKEKAYQNYSTVFIDNNKAILIQATGDFIAFTHEKYFYNFSQLRTLFHCFRLSIDKTAD